MKRIVVDFPFEFVTFIAMVCLIAVWFFGCGKPKLVDVMPVDGVRCKAEITLPNGQRVELSSTDREMLNQKWFITRDDGTSINVDVRIYDCK